MHTYIQVDTYIHIEDKLISLPQVQAEWQTTLIASVIETLGDSTQRIPNANQSTTEIQNRKQTFRPYDDTHLI